MWRSTFLFTVAAFCLWPGLAGAQTNLVFNGDGESGSTVVDDNEIPDGWVLFETSSGEDSTVTQVDDNGPSRPGAVASHFHRNGGTSGDHTTVEQLVGLDITGCTALTLNLDVKVISHNLEAGGCCEFEWPLYVRITYQETDGTPRTWLHGYYIDPPGTGTPSPNETLVSQDTWFPDSFDLLAELDDPGFIDTIRVGGSGWSFESRADNVEILCTGVIPCGTNVIDNDDLEGGFTTQGDSDIPDGWTLFETSPNEDSVVSDSADNGPSLPGEHAVRFLRNGGTSGDHTTIEQQVDLDVSAAECLILSLDGMVISHNLEAGGCCEFEWPLYVQVFYEEANGTQHNFRWGYYIEPPGTGTPSPNETLVPQGTWFTDSFDLLAELTNPALITKIRVGGSGWSFESQADNIRLFSDVDLFIRGDADGDGVFNGLLDALTILGFQFSGGPPPPCLEAADADGDAIFNGLLDALLLLNHQFNGGPAPASPYPACGADPAPASSLGCATPPSACLP